MKIEKHRMVTLTYDLKIDDQNGEVVEQVTSDKPLRFLYGAGMMLPEFELKLAGLQQGEEFEISLDHHDAYGEVNDDAILDLPKHIFNIDGKFDEDYIKIGNTIPMMSGEGQRLNGIVLKIEDESVRMDFNHPLAGEDLYFRGEILEVRQATDEEIVNHLSGCSGCHGSDDSSDCCSSGCCSGSC